MPDSILVQRLKQLEEKLNGMTSLVENAWVVRELQLLTTDLPRAEMRPEPLEALAKAVDMLAMQVQNLCDLMLKQQLG